MKQCYACGKPRKSELCRVVRCSDEQTVFVGPECFRRIKRSGEAGYQPPLGGPRLFLVDKAPPLPSARDDE
jgi:hypothetical protein